MLSAPDALDEDAVPERELVVHRRDELDRLRKTLSPPTPSDLTYLIGPTGTGKTMLSKLVVDILERKHNIRTVYINCWEHYERTAILYQAVSGLCDAAIQRGSTGRSELIDYLNDDPPQPQILILDEADQLADKRVLYDLHEAPVNVVLIANNEDDLFADIDDRVRSRLAVGQRIECGAYSTRELAEILEQRAAHALPSRRYTPQHLDWIADHADGDARVAIRTLRVANEQRDGNLDRPTIDEALPQARSELRQKSLHQLNDHQRAAYDVIADVDDTPLTTTEVAERYQKRVDNPRTTRQVRTYLRKLHQYNLLERHGTSNYRWSLIE